MTGPDLRVLHLVTSDQRRGAETFAADLVGELDRRGMRSELWALSSLGGSDVLDIATLAGGRFDLRGLTQLRHLVRGSDIAVAHGSSALPAMAIASVGLHVPFVYRGIGEPLYWSNTAARRARTRWALGRAAAVSAIWSGAAQDLVSHLGVDPRKVRVIPRGVPSERFALTDAIRRAAARRHFGLHQDVPVLAIVGALAPEKRVDLAIDAVARLPEIRLLVAGDGPDRGALERQAHAMAANRCQFVGRVANPGTVYAAADALLLTSDSEGIPGVVIEAAFTGLPTVATRAGGVVDVIEHHVTGVTVDRGDVAQVVRGVAEVLADRHEMGRAARDRCLARFELATVAEKWTALLLDVASETMPR